jgi:diguanylate cyclase (GGDEF)-like protein
MFNVCLRRFGALPVIAMITMLAVLGSLAISLFIHTVVMGTPMSPGSWLVTVLAPAIIAPSMSHYKLRFIMELERTKETLRQLSESDHLTQAYNRRFFIERLQQEIERMRRYGSRFAVAFIDVDDFKAINDRHGHLGGDAVLRQLADVCMAQLRTTDTFARFGGEEFAVLMPETAPEEALKLLERLRTRVEAMRVELPDAVAKVTVSVGLAAPDTDHDANRILNNADRRLYAAKRQGKNRVVFQPEPA